MKYLVQFSHSYFSFRLPELDSLLVLFGLNKEDVYDVNMHKVESPFFIIELPNESVAKQIASRAVLIKSIYEFWECASTFDELVQKCSLLTSEFYNSHKSPDASWKINVECFGKDIPSVEQFSLFEEFTKHVHITGPVRMKNPELIIKLAFDFGHSGTTPRKVFLGRFVANGQRSVANDYDLKKRKYIGPTSTCAELAFLMSNQILSSPGDLVWDCFSGTGSLLIAASVHGAHCLGTDIDVRVLKGIKKGKKAETVRTNFEQYHLRYPELIRADLSCLPFNLNEKFCVTWREIICRINGILCDPPYGIRAGARKTCSKRYDLISLDVKEGHIPRTEIYNPDDLLVDLLNTAARCLVMGGRITYLLPTCGVHRDDEIPEHPCLEWIATSTDELYKDISRRLVTMKKRSKYIES